MGPITFMVGSKRKRIVPVGDLIYCIVLRCPDAYQSPPESLCTLWPESGLSDRVEMLAARFA